jgi:uncharacterized protein (DUF362 family)/Pyruvate/2-oxoacid:ferredoxin oxidoreductase delta subunit
VNQSTVALVRCTSYDSDAVYDALKRGVTLLGGADRFARPGERILLKPNILAAEEPEKAVTTHPAVLAGCTRLLREVGAQVCFGDSPGLDNPTHAASRSGLREAGEQSGAEFVPFFAASLIANPDGALVDSFPVADPVHACDGMINLPKMKTHQLTRITGAIKNLYGCIPGKRKALYHVQFQDVFAFSRLLVELNLRLRPRLHVMDGILGMEGNGPRSGDPRLMHVLIMSEDPVAVDATFCRLVAMDPEFGPTTTIGRQQGLGRFHESEIEYLGDFLEPLRQPDFKTIRKPVYANASYAHYNVIKNAILPKPVIDAGKCVGCGRCVEACPVPDKALRFENGRRIPTYHYDLCIRCYCCHEMCPQRAIEKKMPLLGRILRIE